METVKDIQELYELKKRIEILETKMLKPKLTNLQYIPVIYDWYKGIASEIQDFPDKGSTEYKQVFLFCILMLYCPRSISGGFMIRCLRQQLSILLSISPSHISNMINPISFYYKKYSKFKAYCDIVLEKLNVDNFK